MLNDDGTGKSRNPDQPMIARELARMGLSLNFYTQWYWKCDLHNIFHFLGLRMDPHAQLEIRKYAEAMGRIVKDVVPIAWEAFKDYELYSIRLSRLEKELLLGLLGQKGILFTEREVLSYAENVGLVNKRERQEALDKLRKLGVVGSEK